MLHACGGTGYKRDMEMERYLRDAKAGWVMGPTNEVLRQFVGKAVLLGFDSLDYWNQTYNRRAVENEIKKLDADGKRKLAEELLAEVEKASAPGLGARDMATLAPSGLLVVDRAIERYPVRPGGVTVVALAGDDRAADHRSPRRPGGGADRHRAPSGSPRTPRDGCARVRRACRRARPHEPAARACSAPSRRRRRCRSPRPATRR